MFSGRSPRHKRIDHLENQSLSRFLAILLCLNGILQIATASKLPASNTTKDVSKSREYPVVCHEAIHSDPRINPADCHEASNAWSEIYTRSTWTASLNPARESEAGVFVLPFIFQNGTCRIRYNLLADVTVEPLVDTVDLLASMVRVLAQCVGVNDSVNGGGARVITYMEGIYVWVRIDRPSDDDLDLVKGALGNATTSVSSSSSSNVETS